MNPMSLAKKVVAQSGGILSLKDEGNAEKKVTVKPSKKKKVKKKKIGTIKKILRKHIGIQLKRAQRRRIKTARERAKFNRMRAKRRKYPRRAKQKQLTSGTVRSRLRRTR